MRQNVQKTIPVHLQPPMRKRQLRCKNWGPCLPPRKIPKSPVKIFLPVTTCSCSRPASPGQLEKDYEPQGGMEKRPSDPAKKVLVPRRVSGTIHPMPTPTAATRSASQFCHTMQLWRLFRVQRSYSYALIFANWEVVLTHRSSGAG